MQKGDISNQLPVRLLVEFEDLLGYSIEEKQSIFKFGKKKTPHPIDWDLDDEVITVMNHMVYNLFQHLEVITLNGPEFATLLGERLTVEGVPASQTWAYEPRQLSRNLIRMPHVAAVYTADQKRAMLYGSRGRLVTRDNVLKMGQF